MIEAQSDPIAGKALDPDKLFPIGRVQNLAFIEAKVYDLELISELRQMQEAEMHSL